MFHQLTLITAWLFKSQIVLKSSPHFEEMHSGHQGVGHPEQCLYRVALSPENVSKPLSKGTFESGYQSVIAQLASCFTRILAKHALSRVGWIFSASQLLLESPQSFATLCFVRRLDVGVMLTSLTLLNARNTCHSYKRQPPGSRSNFRNRDR